MILEFSFGIFFTINLINTKFLIINRLLRCSIIYKSKKIVKHKFHLLLLLLFHSLYFEHGFAIFCHSFLFPVYFSYPNLIWGRSLALFLTSVMTCEVLFSVFDYCFVSYTVSFFIFNLAPKIGWFIISSMFALVKFHV